jgi:hypothetical protein
MQVRQHLDVHGEPCGAGLDERIEIPIRILDHQVHVERPGGDPRDGLDHGRPNREVGHEVTVHHIDVNEIRAAALHGGDVAGQMGEIRRQDGRRQAHAHRLTSNEMASPG